MNKQKLILLRGLPGSGKSTLAKWLCEIDERGNVVTVEADQFFMEDGVYHFDTSRLADAHRGCQKLTMINLQIGYDVIVSNTSTTEKEVATYQQIASDMGVDFISLICENRHNGVNVHNVPEDKLQAMKQRFSVWL